MYINTQTVLDFCDRLSFHTNTIYSLQHSTPSFRKYSIYFHFLSISLAQKLVRCQNLQKCACGKNSQSTYNNTKEERRHLFRKAKIFSK